MFKNEIFFRKLYQEPPNDHFWKRDPAPADMFGVEDQFPDIKRPGKARKTKDRQTSGCMYKD